MTDGEYEVERIVDKRFNPYTKGYEYKIKWKGYSSEEDTWEPRENLTHCQKLLRSFDNNFKNNGKKTTRIVSSPSTLSPSPSPSYSSLSNNLVDERNREKILQIKEKIQNFFPNSLNKEEWKMSKDNQSANENGNGKLVLFLSKRLKQSDSTNKDEDENRKDEDEENQETIIKNFKECIKSCNKNHGQSLILNKTNENDIKNKDNQKTVSTINNLDIRNVINNSKSKIMNSSLESEYQRLQKFILDNSMKRFRQMLMEKSSHLISAFNHKTLDLPPLHFSYIESFKYGANVPLPDDDFLTCCECTPTITMGSNGKKRNEKGNSGDNETCCNTLECACTRLSGRFPYNENGKLREINSSSNDNLNQISNYGAIYECNKKCKCQAYKNNCKNRVIQTGRLSTMSLAIEHMGDSRAWGVITLKPIEAGTFLDQYFGEILPNEMATERYVKILGSDHRNMYLFDLDYNYENGMESEFTVDAYKFGSLSRFFNHSCDPNLMIISCFIDTHDPRLHSLAFFTSRDIKKGEELCFDYRGRNVVEEERGKEGRGGNTKNNFSFKKREKKEEKEGFIVCNCGSSKCRKYII